MDEQVMWDVELSATIHGQRHIWSARATRPGRLRDVCRDQLRKMYSNSPVAPYPDFHFERRRHDSRDDWRTFDPFASVEEPATRTHPCA